MANQERRVDVCIVYPADPLGSIPGGIDTCIKGILEYAPNDIRMSMVGVSAGNSNHEIRRWTNLDIGGASFRFFPLIHVANEGKQSRIPLSLRFCATLPFFFSETNENFDVLQFHRIEPAILYTRSRASRVAFVHQNMAVIRDKNSDIRWRYAPFLYFALERLLIPKFDEVFCVHRGAAASYRERFQSRSDNISFLPSWVDPSIFFPANPEKRGQQRSKFRADLNLGRQAQILVFLGRLERQKNPQLLIRAFKEVALRAPEAHLVIIGDGSLRAEVDALIESDSLQSRVTFLGPMHMAKVADCLRAADSLLLTSTYEGMPRCVNEALGCGLPVISSRVGEVELVLRDGHNGKIVDGENPSDFANAILSILAEPSKFSVTNCVNSIQEYVPQKVLLPLYEKYRELTYT